MSTAALTIGLVVMSVTLLTSDLPRPSFGGQADSRSPPRRDWATEQVTLCATRLS